MGDSSSKMFGALATDTLLTYWTFRHIGSRDSASHCFDGRINVETHIATRGHSHWFTIAQIQYSDDTNIILLHIDIICIRLPCCFCIVIWRKPEALGVSLQWLSYERRPIDATNGWGTSQNVETARTWRLCNKSYQKPAGIVFEMIVDDQLNVERCRDGYPLSKQLNNYSQQAQGDSRLDLAGLKDLFEFRCRGLEARLIHSPQSWLRSTNQSTTPHQGLLDG